MHVTTFFRFADLKGRVESIQQALLDLPGLAGIVLLADEGINATVAGDAEAIARLRGYLQSVEGLEGLEYKDSGCPEVPFLKWKVQIKDQVIRYKEGFKPDGKRQHLNPAEWHKLIHGDEPITVLDTRNYYETKVGLFKNAVDPGIEKFTEFADYLDGCSLPKDQKTLIYCTGGIRCEKAIIDMQERGFTDVHQLDGGILKYLEEFPDDGFEGECFVFDHRVAVDQHLQPSKTFWICAKCGDPGTIVSECVKCGSEARLCKDCADTPLCSKNCAYHWKRSHPVDA